MADLPPALSPCLADSLHRLKAKQPGGRGDSSANQASKNALCPYQTLSESDRRLLLLSDKRAKPMLLS